MITKLTGIALLLAFTFLACDKDSDEENKGSGKVAIYLLQKEERVAGKCQIDADRSTLRANPIVSNDDIVYYDSAAFSFKVSAAAWQRLNKLGDWASLAITLKGRIVYCFFHKPGFSSSSCGESITMQLRPVISGFTTEETVQMSLGYPGPWPDVDDKRNDAALIAALKAQGKLR